MLSEGSLKTKTCLHAHRLEYVHARVQLVPVANVFLVLLLPRPLNNAVRTEISLYVFLAAKITSATKPSVQPAARHCDANATQGLHARVKGTLAKRRNISKQRGDVGAQGRLCSRVIRHGCRVCAQRPEAKAGTSLVCAAWMIPPTFCRLRCLATGWRRSSKHRRALDGNLAA